MLGFAARLCIIAKKSVVVVNVFIFKVFVWAKFTCAGKSMKVWKSEHSQPNCKIQCSSLAHSPFHGVQHVCLSYLTFSVLLGPKRGGCLDNLKDLALPEGEMVFRWYCGVKAPNSCRGNRQGGSFPLITMGSPLSFLSCFLSAFVLHSVFFPWPHIASSQGPFVNMGFPLSLKSSILH